IRFEPRTSSDALIAKLVQHGGFDEPTAHWIAMRSLGEPDVAPFGAGPFSSSPSRGTRPFRGERWRPWGSYVAVLAERRSEKSFFNLAKDFAKSVKASPAIPSSMEVPRGPLGRAP